MVWLPLPGLEMRGHMSFKNGNEEKLNWHSAPTGKNIQIFMDRLCNLPKQTDQQRKPQFTPSPISGTPRNPLSGIWTLRRGEGGFVPVPRSSGPHQPGSAARLPRSATAPKWHSQHRWNRRSSLFGSSPEADTETFLNDCSRSDFLPSLDPTLSDDPLLVFSTPALGELGHDVHEASVTMF